MTDTSTVRLDVREHIAHLTLARADAANTMNLQLGREFLAAALAIRTDPRVRAVLLTGEGKNFCFGGDLRGMVASGGDIAAFLTELTTNLHAGMAHLMRASAPLIAAVVKTTGICKQETIEPMIANKAAFHAALKELHILPLKPVAA